ncbi:P-loop containing nucleoside triphosphate hydrolase protein [Hanseniaspora valbyensis NRRL Y-1626]|uniref:p-loop containing nucleoside triphosphate hydrolase protein n=1 Tax=Hanseniaspora valbyensis NRRL Y-1626 TaxID=766949 RepID=A0A1B7T8J8_9ASCO|nr:P-loop containing nucleoside triphosphate hydrolase protein [Hanseniaspora valbyensis NRRL Y-1626]
MMESAVILITCCDFVFKTNDTKEENEADIKNDISYLKWQKLFLKISEILNKKTLILQFENEQSIPDFFKRLYLLDKTITNLQIDYKTKKKMFDYRDCINISKLTSDNRSDGIKYVPLNQRETTSQHTPKETHKPLYGFKEIINKIKLIYETPYIYFKLYNQFPKMNKHMLLYGAPSMGKSLLIKHLPRLLEIGDTTSISWRYVNALSLISKYTGESERNVRDLFTEARSKIKQNLENNNNEKEKETDGSNITSLSFIIIDNIQTLLPTRSETATITDRLVNTFLTELDGIDSNILNDGLVVIGTTNRPDLVDPALVRPGRLENKIKIDYNAVDWEEIVSNGMKDYFNEKGLEKEIEKDIVTLVKTKKCSIGTFLGALYEVKLELEEEDNNTNKLDYDKLLSLLNEKLIDENDIYMHFEKVFKKFDNSEDTEEENSKRIGVEMAFA